MEKLKELLGQAWELLSTYMPESPTTRAILVGATFGLVVYYATKKRYRLPPTAPGSPLVGHMLSVRKGYFCRRLKEMGKTHGPVFTITMGPVTMIVLNSYDAIQEAFIKKSTDFAGRPVMYSGSVLTEGYKDIAFTDYGPGWQLHRRLALKALKYYMKGDRLDDTICDVMGVVMDNIRAFKEPVDPDQILKLLTFNILSKICFDERFTIDNEEFVQFTENLEKFRTEFASGCFEDVFPPLRLCPTPMFRRFKQTVAELLAFIYKRINHHRDTFKADVQRDFTDAILLAQREAEAEENPELMALFTDTHVGQTVADVFEAGHNTTQQTLYWVVLFAAAFPEVQAKVHKELDAVLGSRRFALMSDRHNLVYTDAFVYECMRYSTVGPLGLPRTTTCDTTIGEYEIPKGTMILANIYAVHFDPNLWHEPDQFRPERFIDSSGKMIRSDTWMPFSVGKRACMAEALAKPELQLLVASLLRNFEILMPRGVKADIEPEPGAPFALAPKPYKVLFRDRLA